MHSLLPAGAQLGPPIHINAQMLQMILQGQMPPVPPAAALADVGDGSGSSDANSLPDDDPSDSEASFTGSDDD